MITPDKPEKENSIENLIEKIIFRSRWILAIFYLVLVLTLLILAIRFMQGFVHFLATFWSGTDAHFVSGVLEMIDMTLIANLLILIIFSGYENFVSIIGIAQRSVDRPKWMGGVDFAGLKIKLIGSLVAISVIELLKDFIELSGQDEVGGGTKWRIVIHITFVASGVLFALMDWIADKREFHGTHA